MVSWDQHCMAGPSLVHPIGAACISRATQTIIKRHNKQTAEKGCTFHLGQMRHGIHEGLGLGFYDHSSTRPLRTRHRLRTYPMLVAKLGHPRPRAAGSCPLSMHVNHLRQRRQPNTHGSEQASSKKAGQTRANMGKVVEAEVAIINNRSKRKQKESKNTRPSHEGHTDHSGHEMPWGYVLKRPGRGHWAAWSCQLKSWSVVLDRSLDGRHRVGGVEVDSRRSKRR